MNIAIDIDDTLTDTFEYLMPFVAEFYEKDLEELQRNNISYSNIPMEWRRYEWDLEKSYYDKVVVRTPFKKEAARYVNLLHQMGHKIVIITGRTKTFYTDPYATTEEELKNGNIVYDRLICTLDKNQACLDEQIDVMIDDLISNCDSVASVKITPILFNREAARICLTHSFHNQSTDEYIGTFDTSDEERMLIEDELPKVTMDDYDRLIQLCDALAGSEGILDIEERMNDVKARYGFYPQSKWDSNIGLKVYFEKKTKRNTYDVVEKESFRL